MLVLAHPTLNDLSPPDFIRVAERTGYDAINLRIIPLEPNTPAANIFNDRKLLRATADALASSPIVVLDVEVIRIEPDTQAGDYVALFGVSFAGLDYDTVYDSCTLLGEKVLPAIAAL